MNVRYLRYQIIHNNKKMKGGDFIKSITRYVVAVMWSVTVLVAVGFATMSDKENTTANIYEFETYSEMATVIENFSEIQCVTKPKSDSVAETTNVVNEIVANKEFEQTTEPITKGKDVDKINTYYSDNDAFNIAKVLYRECRGIPSTTEQACVAWTILNRVDSNNSSIRDVISSPNQFAFYDNTPVDSFLLDLAYDVLDRWSREKNGETDVGRVLPESFLWFEGRGGHNYFRDSYSGDYMMWDYSLESPYES